MIESSDNVSNLFTFFERRIFSTFLFLSLDHDWCINPEVELVFLEDEQQRKVSKRHIQKTLVNWICYKNFQPSYLQLGLLSWWIYLSILGVLIELDLYKLSKPNLTGSQPISAALLAQKEMEWKMDKYIVGYF